MTATNDYGSNTTTKVDYITVAEPSVKVKVYSNADIPVAGEITGDYTLTAANDGINEQITEVLSSKHPIKTTSYLEHKWTFNIPGGNSVAFYLEAYRPYNSESDNFVFEYSTDDIAYYNLITVNSATEKSYLVQLPNSPSGIIYVRVTDSDSSLGNTSLDSICIDEMYFEVDITPMLPMADFIGEPITGYSPLTVQFTDQSTGASDSWSWDFGDGTTSIEQNPSHTYTNEGSGTYKYTVTLTASNDLGSDTSDKTDYIIVNENTGNTTVHVEDLIVNRITEGINNRGQAQATVYDNYGNLVSGAVVFGTFNFPNQTVKSGTTGAGGIALISGDKTRDSIDNFCFTVTDIDLSGAMYDPSENIVTESCE